MIKNIDEIISHDISQIEWIFKEFGMKAVELENNGELIVNIIEMSAKVHRYFKADRNVIVCWS